MVHLAIYMMKGQIVMITRDCNSIMVMNPLLNSVYASGVSINYSSVFLIILRKTLKTRKELCSAMP